AEIEADEQFHSDEVLMNLSVDVCNKNTMRIEETSHW
ncbi:hypothetical protein Tco_0191848, partial [Tanacetum coccineum]